MLDNEERLATVQRIVDRCGHITHLLGVDESGTGAWAGSFYLAAVLAPRGWFRAGVRDSKKTSKTYRAEMVAELNKDSTIIHAEAAASPDDIDKHTHAGAYRNALVLAVGKVIEKCPVPMKNLAIIVDGKGSTDMRSALRPFGCINILFITKADEFVPHVSAASIYAKYNRDVEMMMLDKKFPGYYFNTNAGYGTPEHIDALVHLGPVPHVHRTER